MNYLLLENKYEVISRIGEGGFGIIYKARDMKTQNIVTIKQIKKKILSTCEDIPKFIFREAQILKDLKGEAEIIDLKDFQINETRKNAYFVYEYHEYDVKDIIYKHNDMTYEQIKSYMIQMIKALQAVHSKNYIHGDIKPENFLISSENKIKLIDFGVSKHANQKNKSTQIGTYNYNAPELISGNTKYGIEVDTWSLGCTFYEMMTREKLISNCCSDSIVANQIIEIFGFPRKEDFPQFFTFPNKDIFLNYTRQSQTSVNDFFEEKLPNEFKPMKSLLLQMLQLNPLKRISLSDALNHPSLSDSKPPENLPLIALAENIFKKANNYRYFHNIKEREDIYEKLRLERIVPPSIL